MKGKCCSKWAEKNKRVKNFFSKFGFTLNIGAALLLLLSYLAPFVPPDFFWPLSFFGLAYPYLVLVNFIFLIIWILQPSKRLLLPLATLLLGFYDFSNTFQLIPLTQSRDQGMMVLSFNVHGFKSDLRNRKANTPKVLEYFESIGADIICLQEASRASDGPLSAQGIANVVPGIHYFQKALDSSSAGSVTFSKYPIINRGEIRFAGSSNLVLFSDLRISDRQIIRVYNCHFQSYSIDPDDYSIIDSLGTGSNNKHINEARKMSYKLKTGFEMRALQARKVADHIRKSPYPVIVCGDFNDTPVSYAYRKVRGDLKDTFVEAGWGISNTYNGVLPSFRIDYILCSQKFTVKNYKRDKVYLSDHFPVRSQLFLE